MNYHEGIKKWEQVTGYVYAQLSPGYRRFFEGRAALEDFVGEVFVFDSWTKDTHYDITTDRGYLDFWKRQFKFWRGDKQVSAYVLKQLQAARHV